MVRAGRTTLDMCVRTSGGSCTGSYIGSYRRTSSGWLHVHTMLCIFRMYVQNSVSKTSLLSHSAAWLLPRRKVLSILLSQHIRWHQNLHVVHSEQPSLRHRLVVIKFVRHPGLTTNGPFTYACNSAVTSTIVPGLNASYCSQGRTSRLFSSYIGS